MISTRDLAPSEKPKAIKPAGKKPNAAKDQADPKPSAAGPPKAAAP